jgi:hypothetical protein
VISLRFARRDTIHLPSRFAWISVVEFGVEGEGDDDELLASLLAQPGADDAYAFNDPGRPVRADDEGVHGPYRMAAITPKTFLPLDPRAARDRLVKWVEAYDLTVAGSPEFTSLAVDAFSEGSAAYALPSFDDMPEIDRDELWSTILGNETGYEEILTISPTRDKLTLIVASDD